MYCINGGNGIGKTSLIKAILEKFQGNISGKFKKCKKLKISVVNQEFSYSGSLKEFAEKNKIDFNIFLNNLHKLGMKRSFFDKKIEYMSKGQQKRVELAKSLTKDAELYIWDEPLNYLDIYNKDQLEKLILKIKPTMIIIDHDIEFINKIANKKIRLTKL